VNPVGLLIFDQGSQLELGNYIPVLHRFKLTKTGLVWNHEERELEPCTMFTSCIATLRSRDLDATDHL
ncbi:hypothetical protein EDC04DRAFT_2575204, partial [Pisolithus marmoratus]